MASYSIAKESKKSPQKEDSVVTKINVNAPVVAIDAGSLATEEDVAQGYALSGELKGAPGFIEDDDNNESSKSTLTLIKQPQPLVTKPRL